MSFPIAPAGAPLGLQPDRTIVRVRNESAATLAVGDLTMFDLHKENTTDNTDYIVGSDTSIFTGCIAPSTAGLTNGWFGVVVEGGVDGAEVKVCVRGIVPAFVEGTDAATLADVLVATDGEPELDSDAASGSKIIGIPLETTAGATRELINVLFNGIEGFGKA